MKPRGKQVKNRGDGVSERRVFVTRPIAEPAIRRLASTARVDLWDDEMPPPPAELRARARQADGVLSMVTDRFDAAMIRALPRLRVISNLAVGVDKYPKLGPQWTLRYAGADAKLKDTRPLVRR